LNKGVDGFRMDVINLLSKVPGLPDAPVTDPASQYQWGGLYFANGPRLLEFLAEMKREVLSKGDVFSVGETPMVTTVEAAAMTNEATGALNMVFQFEHMTLDSAPVGLGKWTRKPMDLSDLKTTMSRWQNDLYENGWNSLYLSNHDQPRTVSRFGDDGLYRVESAKMLGTFLHLLQGTPFVYQGEEIGMTNVAFNSIDDYNDIEEKNFYHENLAKGYTASELLKMIAVKGRDNARTPMQWSDESQAGFTTGTPWLKVNQNYKSINVQQARADPNSIYHYYRKLIQLRKENPVMVYGHYELLDDVGNPVYAYLRTLGEDRLLVVLNFGREQPAFDLPARVKAAHGQLLISNYPSGPDDDCRHFVLRPWEARVYRLA
jgi:oligo-1,6-glucosidase